MNTTAHTLTTGIVFSNPEPHLRSRHGYFPSVITMDNGEMLSLFSIGEAFESVNLDVFISRSKDAGVQWSNPVALIAEDAKNLLSYCGRIAGFADGSIAVTVARFHRELHAEEGLANPENIGFVPTDLLLIRSFDRGHSWELPQIVQPPLVGPSFEMCSPIVPLQEGRWLWPTSTMRNWEGDAPNGTRMVSFVSNDAGKTWPEYMSVMDGSADGILYLEGKIIELANRSLLAVSWAYSEREGKDLPNHYSLSSDGGATWMAPLSTGLHGQTLAIAELPDNRLISVFRRMDKPGLWAVISELENGKWKNTEEIPLWGMQESSLLNKQDNVVKGFNELKFGAPNIRVLPGNCVYIVFWCYEKMISNIRWIKLNIHEGKMKSLK